MRASMSHDTSAVTSLSAGFVGAVVLLVGMLGCGPAAAPSKPAVVHPNHAKHDDHDHDHDKHVDKDHDHGTKDHDDHDHVHPETLAAGVAELEAMWGHVKGALKAGDREKADEKVHAVGHLLEDFEGLLAKEKADAEDVGKKATQEVFDCFDTLDEAFHGDEDALKKLDIDALGERLEAAIKTLKSLATGETK